MEQRKFIPSATKKNESEGSELQTQNPRVVSKHNLLPCIVSSSSTL
jgi:hypothetical protein